MCAIGFRHRRSVQRHKVAGPLYHACFVGRSTTSGQRVLKSVPPLVLRMVLIGRPAGSRLQEFHTRLQNVQSEINTHVYRCKQVYMYCPSLSVPLCVTRLVAQRTDTYEALSSRGSDDHYSMDGCAAHIACPLGRAVRGDINKKRPGPIVTHFVGRSATSRQAIAKSLPPNVPKMMLIDWLTRVPAAGTPYYTTRSPMWNRTGIFH